MITTLRFCILLSLFFVFNELEHLLDIKDKEAPLASRFQGEGATCSLNLFRELGNKRAGQSRFFWLVVVTYGTSNIVTTRQFVFEMLGCDPEGRQQQPFLGNIFANCCPLALLVAQFPSRHGEQQDHGEESTLLLDVVVINHGDKWLVASKCCCLSK